MANKTIRNEITIKEIWEMFFANIWLFAISWTIAILGGYIYIERSPLIYERSASVIIKDEKSGKSVSGSSMQFDELGLLAGANINVNNEVQAFMRIDFMTEVVNRLKINCSYSEKELFRWKDLYHQAPIEIDDKSLSNKIFSINVEFISESEFMIPEFIVSGNEISLNSVYNINENVILPTQDTIVVSKNALFADDIELTDKTYRYQKNSIKYTAKYYASILVAMLRSKDLSIIDLYITDTNPQRAEDILNTLISVYNENWILKRNEMVLSTSNFIQNRLSVIEQELGDIDTEISNFKSKNLLPDAATITNLQINQVVDSQNKLVELNSQLSMAKYIQYYLSNSQTANGLLPVNTGVKNEHIDNLIVRYNETLVQKNLYSDNSSAKNPVIEDLINNLNAQKQLIRISIDDLIETITLQIREINTLVSKQEQQLIQNPKQSQMLLSSERNQLVKEQLYLFLLQKREENELSQAFTAYNTEVMSFADGYNIPIEPKSSKVLLYAFILGTMLPVGYILARMIFNTSVQNRDDLKTLNIPVIGSIPSRKNTKNDSSIVVSAGCRDIINEAFRVIRSNLDFVLGAQDKQVIQIISMHPGSGKTFVSTNIALSMALKNTAKVLIIDVDLRKATLSKLSGESKSGLSSYLSGQITNVDDIIAKESIVPMLDIIPVGSIPPNPSELLLSDKFRELIDVLKSRYDFIYLDCPPVEIVPDAAIIAKYCSSSIFVVRAGLMDKRELPYLQEIYESKKYNNFSLLLNAVQTNKNGYGKYGYNNYGYYANEKSK